MGAHGRQDDESSFTEAAPWHARVEELLAAYADGELAREDRRAIEEHLRECPRCQRELTLQQALSTALSREPTPEASADLRRRIEWMGEPASRPRVSRRVGRAAVAVASVMMTLLVVGGATLLARRNDVRRRPPAEIPLVHDALADCRRVMGRNFPRKADLPALAKGVQFPVPVLDRPDLELFSTWNTTLAGAPAAGLAYHWQGIVIVQYTVATELIRQQPGVGEALATAGFYAASDHGQGVVARLRDGSGTLLVADLAPDELRRLML